MATKRWVGKALDIRQVDTIAVGGTWATSETITLTIGARDVIITIGANTSTAQVATTIYEAWQGQTLTDTTASVNVVDSSGVSDVDTVPEFAEITASVSSSTVTLRADTRGKPFTLSVSETSTSGTLTHTNDGSGSSVVATGKNWFDNADNWDTGTIPTTGDDIWFDGVNVACKYGLDQSSLSLLDVHVTASHTAHIGLPETNSDDASNPYTEYRDKYLTFSAITGDVRIGAGTGNGSGLVRIDGGSGNVPFKVYKSGTRYDQNIPSTLLKSTGTDSSLYAEGTADVGFGYFADESGHLGTIRVLDTAKVYVGTGVDVANPTITMLSGTLELNSDMNAATVNQGGGTITVGEDPTGGTISAVNVRGGTFNNASNMTVTTAVVGSDGTLDFDGNQGAIGCTNCTLEAGATLKDNLQRVSFTNDIILNECGVEDVTLELGTEITLSRV